MRYDAPSAASRKVLATLLIEGLTQPRTTYFMSTLDRLEELVVAVVALLGLLASGALTAPCRTMPYLGFKNGAGEQPRN